MKKILCPTDFSLAADNAIEYAANVAKKMNATLTLLHVQQEESSQAEEDSDETAATSASREQINSTMEAICREVDKSFDVQADYDILAGNLEDAIVNKAGGKLYDMIVMGTTPDLFYQYFVGTNTYHILRRVETPVLVVPDTCVYKDIDSIVYASNYQENDNLSLRQLKEIADLFDAGITVLHVSRKQSEVSQQVFDAFKDHVEAAFNRDRNVSFERVFAEDEAAAINQFVLEQNADLLGIYMKRRGFIERLFHKSVTKKLSAMAEYPVLVFH